MKRFAWLSLFLLILAHVPAQAQQYPPTFEYASIMKADFADSSGLLRFRDFIVVFAPEGPFSGEVAVINSDGETLARFPFFEHKEIEDGVFARVNVQGPAEVSLTKPGIYNIIFLVNGKSVTRFPFVVRETKGDDPFQPGSTYAADGLWRTLAYFTTVESNHGKTPLLNLWTGGLDLPEGKNGDQFQATLLKGGKVLAHSKKNQGHIPPGHFAPDEVGLFHPHDDRQQVNARPFTLEDFGVDGAYELRVARQSDGERVRNFKFSVKGGEIQGLARSALGYEPALDFILPRVSRRAGNVYLREEAIWIEGQN